MSSILFEYVVPTVHVLSCIFLIVVVLLQTGKGADMGAVLGGGSQTLFGASGAGNLLTKLTTGMAITFMATSLVIAVGQRRTPTSSLIDRLPAAETETAPAIPPPAGLPAPSQADGVPVPNAAVPAPAAEPAAPAADANAPAAEPQAKADDAAAPAAPSGEPAAAPNAPAEAPSGNAPSAPAQ